MDIIQYHIGFFNIFEKNTPLHDGAVIVRGNRIVSATSYLPITSSQLDKNLGTRHRAGMGISEETDALTLIVSEETGTISVAVGGMLKRYLAPQTLEKLLRNELCPKEESETEKNLAQLLKSLSKKDKEGDGYEK